MLQEAPLSRGAPIHEHVAAGPRTGGGREFAIALGEAMIARFYDPENGGFWQSAPGAKDLILRVKEDYDGAEPSE